MEWVLERGLLLGEAVKCAVGGRVGQHKEAYVKMKHQKEVGSYFFIDHRHDAIDCIRGAD